MNALKTNIIIRFMLAVFCTTLVSIDTCGTLGTSVLLPGSWIFFISRSELAKPVSAGSIVFAIIVLCSSIVDFFYFFKTRGVFRFVTAAVIWIGLMICFYYEWRRAKTTLPIGDKAASQ